MIAGSVKDSSGAVLPGVSVEAASPALIEKVRTAVTDGTGQYRVEDLRPGTYTVTFTLQGFSTYKREGIELTGSFTATVNADLKVGTLAETITVTGETPVVDVQSAKREMTLNTDIVKAIPTVRSYNAMVVLVPGVVTNLNDVVTGTATTQFPIHGGRNNEGRLQIDGLNVGNPPGGNQPPGYTADIGNAQEINYITSGGLGEAETAGLVMNVVPKTGGNKAVGLDLPQLHRQEPAGRQPLGRREGRGSDDADAAHQGVRHQWRRWRSDQAGSRVVLRQCQNAGEHESDCAGVLQRRMPATRPSGCTCPRTSRNTPTGPGKTRAGGSPGS